MSEKNFTTELRKLRRNSRVSSDNSSNDSLDSVVEKMRKGADEVKENLYEMFPLKELQETIRKNSGEILKYVLKGATANTSLPNGKKNEEKQIKTSDVIKPLGIKYAGLGTNGGLGTNDGLGTSGTLDKTTVDNSLGTSAGVGEKIKNSLSEALKPKYGDIGIKGIFDKIGDSDVVKYLNQAKDSIKRNVKNGILTEEKLADYPNMENGLAMFYAADEKGDKKAAKMAYEAAYTEGDSADKSNDAVITVDDSKKDTETYTNNSRKNSDSVYFYDTQIIKPKYQKVYHGDIWSGEKQTDLDCKMLSEDELRAMKWINRSDFTNSESDHIANWRWLANSTSVGEMQDVVNDMITHFLDGTGTDYTNKTLTRIVGEHKITKAYMQDFTKVFKEFLEINNGNVKEFANSKDFKDSLRANGVLFSTYAYKGIDTFTGLRMAIHGWTESDVDVEMLEVLPNGNYYGRLKFTFVDNFGLDADDIEEFGQYAGFRSWYILQHYDKYNGKYKPFRTIVTVDYPFFGKL